MPVSQLILLLEMLVTHAPQITADVVKSYADIAHGEGGLAKVQTAVIDFGQVLADAAGVIPPAAAPVVTPVKS